MTSCVRCWRSALRPKPQGVMRVLDSDLRELRSGLGCPFLTVPLNLAICVHLCSSAVSTASRDSIRTIADSGPAWKHCLHGLRGLRPRHPDASDSAHHSSYRTCPSCHLLDDATNAGRPAINERRTSPRRGARFLWSYSSKRGKPERCIASLDRSWERLFH